MKKTFAFILTITILVFAPFLYLIKVNAHNALLEVDYDECIPKEHGDGDDERWYYLNNYNNLNNKYNYYHLNHNVTTIKYYFSNVSKDDKTYTWDTEVTPLQAEEARNAYINSLLKWNNKYYFSYDAAGNRIANRIINIEEGTENDHNLTIYPMGADEDDIASTSSHGTSTKISNRN